MTDLHHQRSSLCPFLHVMCQWDNLQGDVILKLPLSKQIIQEFKKKIFQLLFTKF